MEYKRILKDQISELEEMMRSKKIVEREVQTSFKNIISSKLIKITTGVRRCGKSVFTYNILKNKFGYVNFDDERLININPDEILSTLIEIHGEDLKTIFFDEIQNLKNWELFVNRLKRQGYDIFITGSNSRLLSKELATHLTGRHLSMEMYPFSFKEYLKAINFNKDTETTKGISLLKHELENYILNSGFPEIIVEKENPKIYLRELYRNIINRDIISRHNIAYRKTFKEISLSLLSNPGRVVSYNKLKKQFNLGSEHTTKNYLSYLEEAYLLLPLSKFSYKAKEIEKSEKKVYVIDSGIVNHVSIKTNIAFGFLLENVVAIDLFRKKSFNPDLWLYYFRDYQQNEVDFVLKEGLKVKQLIQVCYSLEDEETRKREIKGLLKASKELKCNNLLIITWDEEDEIKQENKLIKVIPLWKWLLVYEIYLSKI